MVRVDNCNLSKWTDSQSVERISLSFKRLLTVLERALYEAFEANMASTENIFSLINREPRDQQDSESQAFWNWMKKHGVGKLESVLSAQTVDHCFNVFDNAADDLLEYRIFLLENDLAGGYKANIVDSIVDTVDELYSYVRSCSADHRRDSHTSYDGDFDEIRVYTVRPKLNSAFAIDDSKALLGGFSFFVSK